MENAFLIWDPVTPREIQLLYLFFFICLAVAFLAGSLWGRHRSEHRWRQHLSDYIADIDKYLETRFPHGGFHHRNQSSATLQPVSKAITRMQQAYHQRELQLHGKISALERKNQSILNRSRKYSRHLLWLASHDPLTGLRNRVSLLKFMEKLIQSGTPFAVLFIDLNEFKKINEQYGQTAGDAVLQEVARRLQQSTDKDGCAAHLNSDDFSLITRVATIEKLEPFVHHLISALSRPVESGSHRITVSLSVGISIFPTDPAGSETLLRHAELAAYQIKHNTLKRYHFFDVEAEQRSRSFKLRYHEIEKAFFNGELEFHYQPKVNMLTGHILGAEALIRWNSPERGMVSPAEFIPVIESTDLIHQVGKWAMTNAILRLNEWKETKLRNLVLSINIAGLQILEGELDKDLHKIFRRYPGVNPRQLELEILETSALDDMKAACRTLNRCRDLGCVIAMDDFGTGYSSLSYFRQLPLDVIKIDQEFVRTMLDEPDSQTLIAVMISIGNLFSKKLIAEGVETEEHGLRLLEMGCEWGQGYAISRPLPETEFINWYHTWSPPSSWLALNNTTSTL